MKKLIILSLFVFSTLTVAGVDQSNVAATLDQMVKDKVISAEEAAKAKAKMKNMSGEQWAAMEAKAQVEAQKQASGGRTPASITEDENEIEDIDGAQMDQIKNDMEAMMPKGNR